MTRIFSLWFLFPSIMILSGCAGASGRASAVIKADAEAIFSSSNCGGFEPSGGSDWISDEKGLASAVNRINGLKIGVSSISTPTVDFTREGVLLIRMGRKPTGGYGIELASNKADISDHTAIITVRWVEPAKNAILAQMITSPCTMIKLAKGSYTTVRVVDQTGIVRAETTTEFSKK
jgi:hypothetical protein